MEHQRNDQSWDGNEEQSARSEENPAFLLMEDEKGELEMAF